MANSRKIDGDAKQPAGGGHSARPMQTLLPDLPDRQFCTLNQPEEAASLGDFGEVTIWRLPKLVATIGLTRSGVYRAIHHDGFPKPICLGRRAVGWRAIDVANWLKARPYASNGRLTKRASQDEE